MPPCGYYQEMYLYDTLHNECNNEFSNFCWQAYGPSDISIGPSTWNFTGEQVYQVQGTFYYITKSFGDFTSKTLQMKFVRCSGSETGGTFLNRSKLYVSCDFKYTVNRAICVNGPTRNRSANSSWQAVYVGDPFAAASGLSDTLYLKSFAHIEGNYCDADPESWMTYINGFPNENGLGSEGSFLQPGTYPGMVPSTVQVVTL